MKLASSKIKKSLQKETRIIVSLFLSKSACENYNCIMLSLVYFTILVSIA